jgi:hypothetical protein
MTEKAKRLGNTPIDSEMHFRQNMQASEECPFEVQTYSGLTKREYFAAMAMQGLLSEHNYDTHERVAVNAVAYGDALCEELSKTE